MMALNFPICMVPWIQVSRSLSLLLMVKPPVFLMVVGMGRFLRKELLGLKLLMRIFVGNFMNTADGSPCFVKSNGLKRSLQSLELADYQMGEAITAGDSQEIDEVVKEWEHNLLQNMMDRVA
ncbi:chromosome-associated kinesin KIF4A-like [Pyrus ussuriensis x Pyrus communis]|uniref:Chromosome-associated kinesin KIF4A-like n=1 Tax=Pyrus ussuriensis x Pyrus communis TaxID=2448454 RepID=A0A5N5FS04_9ROSA|nr:chromosome-associated kinesin KIF4A-like [Pyrus ussuriensis x Pyrus communis]